MPRKRLTTSVPAKASKKNKAGDIGVTSSGNYKVWTGDGWSGNYESQTGAIDYMKTLHGDIGPRLVETRKRGGLGLTKKDLPVKRKRTPAMGFTSKDVKQGKKALEPKITKRRREKIAKDILSKASVLLPYGGRTDVPELIRGLGRAMTERRYKPKKREKSPISEPMAMSKKGGTVSRKSGGKIMYGYKAGGRV